jgi:SAM-dependent methyltransferase
MQPKNHWDRIYRSRPTDGLSWYQAQAETSLRLIRELAVPHSAAVIDVGGGASPLAADLLAAGYADITVLDVSAEALAAAQRRMGAAARRVRWVEADITRADLPGHVYDLWHDRAVLHFLTDPDARHAYITAVEHAVRPGGLVIVATFAEDGPTECSGLPVQRYSAAQLRGLFGAGFEALRDEREVHRTPAGKTQSFVYCCLRRKKQAG